MQHLHEILDLNKTALDWMMQQFPDIKEREEMRKIIGRYGLSGQQQVRLYHNTGAQCSVVEYLTQDRGVAGSSLTGVICYVHERDKL